MDKLTKPYKVEFREDTYEGNWNAEQIENGQAGKPKTRIVTHWYENTPSGPQVITDPERIQQLEEGIQNRGQ